MSPGTDVNIYHWASTNKTDNADHDYLYINMIKKLFSTQKISFNVALEYTLNYLIVA